MIDKPSEIILYTTPDGFSLPVPFDVSGDTIWLTQAQMAELFMRSKKTISEHITNIFADEELEENSAVRNFRTTAADGKTYNTMHYNLDVIISVGYRVKSIRGTHFRQWATKHLRNLVLDGYAINPDRISQNKAAALKALEHIQALLPEGAILPAFQEQETESITPQNVLELVQSFASTWFSLSAFDAGQLPEAGMTEQDVALTADDLLGAISELRADLLQKEGQGAADLLMIEREEGLLNGIIGNVFQSVFGADAYPTVEEKAAHLLYFIVKDHPFRDGNKRSGAFAFVWFLSRAGLLRTDHITPEALTTLTLLIVQSPPREKDRMIGLVLLLLRP